MGNPQIYLTDKGRILRGKNKFGVLAYYLYKDNIIVFNRRITKISIKNLIYIINHEFFHAILHRLHFYKSREDFDNLQRKGIILTKKGVIR